MNLETNNISNNSVIIGIGGISRAGKSTLITKLAHYYKIEKMVRFDEFLIAPLLKNDYNAQSIIEDWEDPKCYDFDKFKDNLLSIKNEELGVKRIVLVEGFLIYYRKDISNIFDYKILLDVDKELARERRKRTKHYGSDYYYDEYIWKGFQSNNIFFKKDEISFVIDSNKNLDNVFEESMKLIDKIKLKEEMK